MNRISRAELLLMLLAADGPRGKHAEPIQGTTRLQKLLFLIDREAKLKASVGEGFGFTAYKFGPVSKSLYDDLEKLENLGLLRATSISAPSVPELDEHELTFDDLMGEEEQESKDTLEEKSFGITDDGLQWLKSHGVDDQSSDIAVKIRQIKGKYGGLSLQDLLRYVYTRFPDMTTASEIKAKVLGS